MMTTTANDTQRDTIRRIAREALGGLDARNWMQDDECEPWLFDQAVFDAAFAARQKMTDDEAMAYIEVGEDTRAYYKTLEELRSFPGGRNFATAHLIVAMYREMEVLGLED